jgi:hypothetical protein
VHGDQHAVEEGEPDRAGVDGGEGAPRHRQRAARIVGEGRRAAPGSQPTEHQHVVPGGAVEVRRQLVVDQVGDVRLEDGAARPALHGRLQQPGVHLELAPRGRDPQPTGRRQLVGQSLLLVEGLRRNVEDVHQRSWRAASSAK